MKKILVLSCVAAGYLLNAQSIGNSPYAAFGIGDVKYDNTVDINAMGGISTAYINDFTNSFNFQNPAANGNFQLTSIKVSGTNENNFYKSDYNDMRATKHSTYLSNISIAFPLSQKMKFGLDFQPYSSKSYNILNSGIAVNTDGNTFNTTDKLSGNGSINTVQGALSYNFSSAFALGLRGNFYFGNLIDLEQITVLNSDNTAYSELINGYESRKKVKMFNFTLGTTYQKKLSNDYKLTAGATATFGNAGKLTNYFKNSTYYILNNTNTNEDIISETVSQDKKLLPTQASLGLGYGKDTKWFLGAQADYKSGETIQFAGGPFTYKDGYKVAVGGWYLPNFNNFRNYFSRVTYRYGAYYEKEGLNINGTDINKFGVTGGVTLPFSGNSSRLGGLDIGLEVGKRGTLSNNLINQNFVNLRIGLNFADKWFNKRYYD